MRQARAQYRHELRTLTYVTIDQANGGIVRNLTHDGLGVQMVAAIPPRQQMRLRFELRYPRVKIEARGEVVWSTFSGQCGIRFLDLPPRMGRQIDEWILGNLLEGASLHPERAGPIFGNAAAQEDGLLISSGPRNVIELPIHPEQSLHHEPAFDEIPEPQSLDWLSRPLSGRSLAWTINSLVVTAAVLLFALVFLSVTRESPPWPFSMAGGAVLCVSLLYLGFFKLFGGGSPGARLARLATGEQNQEEEPDRFR